MIFLCEYIVATALEKVYLIKRKENLEGLRCASRAVNIDPNCQHAYQALAWAHVFLHNVKECVTTENL